MLRALSQPTVEPCHRRSFRESRSSATAPRPSPRSRPASARAPAPTRSRHRRRCPRSTRRRSRTVATNLWGTPLAFLEPESEHSSATAAEGFALAGGRVANFTAGQGLILMKEVLYVIAGKRLPVVFHVGARALTSQSLNIHAGHDDVMGVADCGWGILFARNVQEAADFTAIARRVAEETEHAVLRRSGRLPDDAHAREREAARGRPAARVRRRSARPPHEPVRPVDARS